MEVEMRLSWKMLWEDDRKIVKSIPICNTIIRDYWSWHYTTSGVFTTKSAYKMGMVEKLEGSSSNLNVNGVWWKRVWGPVLPQKIKIFL